MAGERRDDDGVHGACAAGRADDDVPHADGEYYDEGGGSGFVGRGIDSGRALACRAVTFHGVRDVLQQLIDTVPQVTQDEDDMLSEILLHRRRLCRGLCHDVTRACAGSRARTCGGGHCSAFLHGVVFEKCDE